MGQPELEKSTEGEPTHFPMPKMAKRALKISWEARLTAQGVASIAKWKTIVGVSMKSFQIGIQLANKPQTDLGDVLDDVLAAKATSTMNARADALIRYIYIYIYHGLRRMGIFRFLFEDNFTPLNLAWMCSTNAYHVMSVQFDVETFHVMSVAIHVHFHVYTMDESVGVFMRGSKGRCQSW